MPLTQVQGGMIVPSTTLTTPIVATTMGVGGATPAGSGSGITFPATQSASTDANTLDDYEEGTWTPTLSALSGSLTSYTSGGYYVKVGSLVTIYGWVRITNAGTAANYAIVANPPFAIANQTSYFRNLGTSQESQFTGNFYQLFTVSSTQMYVGTTTNTGITWTNNYTYPFQLTYQAT